MSETTPQATSPPSPSSSSALSSPPLSSPSAAGPDVGSAQVRSPDPSKKSRISSSSSSPSSRSRNETGDDQSISETCQGKKPLSSSSSPPLHHGGVSTRKPSPSSPPVSTATTPPPPPPSVTPIAWDSQEVRRYEGEVLTVLHTFDRAKEWADLNNCLQKLLRVFSHPAAAVSSSYAPFSTLGTPPFFPFVPHKAVVAKRLAQCLNPLLPSGVHTRALETYAAIFERIGPDGLSKDLATYSAGLLPFFQDGATHVKPLFLDLINAYYLPLGRHLIPCLSGLLVSMLPGLDDDKAPTFGYVASTIWKLSDCVGERLFVAALWRALLRASRVRLAALNLLMQLTMPSLPALIDDAERIAVLLPDRPHLVVGALEATFNDESSLVKRHLLDLLIKNFPFDQPLLTRHETIRLLRAALRVLPLREWSLTRRFIQWITQQPNGILDVIDLSFLVKYVKAPLIEVVRLDLQETPRCKKEATYPLKSLSILIVDNEDLEGLAHELMPSLTVPLLRYLLRESSNAAWGSGVLQEAQQLFHVKLTHPDWVWSALGLEMQQILHGLEQPPPPRSSSFHEEDSSHPFFLTSRYEAAERIVEILLLAELYLDKVGGGGAGSTSSTSSSSSSASTDGSTLPGHNSSNATTSNSSSCSSHTGGPNSRSDDGDDALGSFSIKKHEGGEESRHEEKKSQSGGGEEGGEKKDDRNTRDVTEETSSSSSSFQARSSMGVDALCGVLSLLSDVLEGLHILAPTYDSIPVIHALLQTASDCFPRVEDALQVHSQSYESKDRDELHAETNPLFISHLMNDRSTHEAAREELSSSSSSSNVSKTDKTMASTWAHPRVSPPSSHIEEEEESKKLHDGREPEGLLMKRREGEERDTMEMSSSSSSASTQEIFLKDLSLTPGWISREYVNEYNLRRKRKRFLIAIDAFFSYIEGVWMGVRESAHTVDDQVLVTLDLLSDMQVSLYRLHVDLLSHEEATTKRKSGKNSSSPLSSSLSLSPNSLDALNLDSNTATPPTATTTTTLLALTNDARKKKKNRGEEEEEKEEEVSSLPRQKGEEGGKDGQNSREEESASLREDPPWPGGCLPTWFCALLECGEVEELAVCCRAIQSFLNLLNCFSPSRRKFIICDTNHCDQVAVRLWNALALTHADGSPRSVTAPSAVADLVLQLEESCRPEKEDVVQAVVMQGLRCSTVWKRLEAIERFSLLWRCSHLQKRNTRRYLYSSPMLAVLQSLEEPEPKIRYAARAFVRQAIHHLPHLLDPIFSLLLYVDPSSFPYVFFSSKTSPGENERREGGESSSLLSLRGPSSPSSSSYFSSSLSHNYLAAFSSSPPSYSHPSFSYLGGGVSQAYPSHNPSPTAPLSNGADTMIFFSSPPVPSPSLPGVHTPHRGSSNSSAGRESLPASSSSSPSSSLPPPIGKEREGGGEWIYPSIAAHERCPSAARVLEALRLLNSMLQCEGQLLVEAMQRFYVPENLLIQNALHSELFLEALLHTSASSSPGKGRREREKEEEERRKMKNDESGLVDGKAGRRPSIENSTTTTRTKKKKNGGASYHDHLPGNGSYEELAAVDYVDLFCIVVLRYVRLLDHPHTCIHTSSTTSFFSPSSPSLRPLPPLNSSSSASSSSSPPGLLCHKEEPHGPHPSSSSHLYIASHPIPCMSSSSSSLVKERISSGGLELGGGDVHAKKSERERQSASLERSRDTRDGGERSVQQARREEKEGREKDETDEEEYRGRDGGQDEKFHEEGDALFFSNDLFLSSSSSSSPPPLFLSSSSSSSYYGAVRSSAAEILRVFLGMVHPISRAREVACLVSEPLIIALNDAIDQSDQAMQSQLLRLLRVVILQSSGGGSSSSPSPPPPSSSSSPSPSSLCSPSSRYLLAHSNKQLEHRLLLQQIQQQLDIFSSPPLSLSASQSILPTGAGGLSSSRRPPQRQTGGGLRLFERGKNASSSSSSSYQGQESGGTAGVSSSISPPPAVSFPLFSVAVETKKAKLPHLKSLAEQSSALIPVLLRSMDLSERSSLLDNSQEDEEEEDTENNDEASARGEEEEGRERDQRTTGTVSAYQRGDADRGRMSYAKTSPYSSYSYEEETQTKDRQSSRTVNSRSQRIDEDYNIEEAVDLSTSFLRYLDSERLSEASYTMIHFFCSQVALAVCPPLTSSSSSFSSHGTSLRTRRERRRESELSQSFSSSSSSHLHPSHPFLLPFKKRLLKGAACEGDGAFLHLPAPSINKREGHAHHRHPPWRREEGIEKKKKRGLSTNSSSSSTRFDDKMDGVCKEIFAKGRRGLHSGEGGPYRKSERRREAWRDCPASSSSSSSSSLVFFGSSISFLNGLHDVLQYVVDRAALGGSSAGGTAGGEPQSAGALLPFFDIFGWASSHVNGDVDPFHKDSSSMNEEQQRVMASVTLLLPTILVACVAAVGATLRRHFHRPHLPSCSSSRFSSSCLVKASWRRQRGEEERSARSEERSSRRNEESQSNGTNVRREGDILDGSSYSSDHATRLSDREKRTESSSSSSSVPLKKNGAPRSFDPLDIERREISGRSSPAYIRSAETRGEGGEQGGEQGEGEGHHDRRTWLDEGSRSRRGREREGKRRERKEQGESHGGSRTRGEEEGGGGGGLGVADLDATRNEEAVRLKVTEVMEVLFKSFPRQFVQSCLAVWGLALNGDREKIGALLFILKQMPSAVLTGLLPPLLSVFKDTLRGSLGTPGSSSGGAGGGGIMLMITGNPTTATATPSSSSAVSTPGGTGGVSGSSGGLLSSSSSSASSLFGGGGGVYTASGKTKQGSSSLAPRLLYLSPACTSTSSLASRSSFGLVPLFAELNTTGKQRESIILHFLYCLLVTTYIPPYLQPICILPSSSSSSASLPHISGVSAAHLLSSTGYHHPSHSALQNTSPYAPHLDPYQPGDMAVYHMPGYHHLTGHETSDKRSKHHPVSSSSSTVTGALGGGGGLASASSSSASGSAPNQQQEEVEAVWSLLLQFVQLAVGQPRQPITPLWLVGILLALDRVKPAKETTVSSSRRTRKDLQDLFRLCIYTAARQFGQRVSTAVNSNAFDVLSPLPPTADVINQALSLSSSSSFDSPVFSSSSIHTTSTSCISSPPSFSLSEVYRPVGRHRKFSSRRRSFSDHPVYDRASMPTTPHTPGVHYRAKGVECTYTGKDGEAPLYACSSSASGSASYLSSSSSPSHRKDFDRKIRLLGYQRIEGRQVERLKEEQARNLGAGGEGGGRGRPSLASPPCVMIINRRLVKHRQLGASIVPSDAAEIAAHHALAVIIMFCVEVGELNRRSPLTALFLHILSDDLPPYILPSLLNQSPQGFVYRYLVLCVLRYFPLRLYPAGIGALKKALVDLLPSTSFFSTDRRTSRCWQRIVAHIVTSDPQKIDLLLPPPHAGVFASKENDLSHRLRYLKRLAFLLFCSDRDSFQPQLASILEKLTEALKLNSSNQAPGLTEQVFLCVRVLLLRLSSSFLTPVWPILLTELIKVFSIPSVSPQGGPSLPFSSSHANSHLKHQRGSGRACHHSNATPTSSNSTSPISSSSPSSLFLLPSSSPSPSRAMKASSVASTASSSSSSASVASSSFSHSLPQIPLPSLSLLLAALKVVDIAALVDLPDFHLYQWMFIQENLLVQPHRRFSSRRKMRALLHSSSRQEDIRIEEQKKKNKARTAQEEEEDEEKREREVSHEEKVPSVETDSRRLSSTAACCLRDENEREGQEKSEKKDGDEHSVEKNGDHSVEISHLSTEKERQGGIQEICMDTEKTRGGEKREEEQEEKAKKDDNDYEKKKKKADTPEGEKKKEEEEEAERVSVKEEESCRLSLCHGETDGGEKEGKEKKKKKKEREREQEEEDEEASHTRKDSSSDEGVTFTPFAALLAAQWSDEREKKDEADARLSPLSTISSEDGGEVDEEDDNGDNNNGHTGVYIHPKNRKGIGTAKRGVSSQGREEGIRLLQQDEEDKDPDRNPKDEDEEEETRLYETCGDNLQDGGPLVTVRRVNTPQELAHAAKRLNEVWIARALRRVQPDESLINRCLENDMLDVEDEVLDLWEDLECSALLSNLWDLYTSGFDLILPASPTISSSSSSSSAVVHPLGISNLLVHHHSNISTGTGLRKKEKDR